MSEPPGQDGTRLEQTILTNVSPLTSTAVLATTSGPLVLFALHDAHKPWYAATDIATAKPTVGEAWTVSRVTDDLSAEFMPRIVAVDTNLALAAWARVSGDISGATNPAQVAPHLEIVAAWLDVATGTWIIEPKEPNQEPPPARDGAAPMAFQETSDQHAAVAGGQDRGASPPVRAGSLAQTTGPASPPKLWLRPIRRAAIFPPLSGSGSVWRESVN